MPVTKLKKGYEAIEFVFKKALTKKGVQGITTIPGPAYKMQIKRLTDAMADKMGKMGYDINNVTEKQVQGLLDYSQAIDNQRLKNIERKFFDPSGKMKKEGQDIVKKGLEGLGKKKDPFMGWTPKVVPKETVTASPDRIRKGFSTQMKLNRPEENQALIKSFMRRENAEFNALSREQQKEIFDMFDAYMKPKPDMASGGIAGELHLYDGGRARFDKGGKFNPGRRKFLKGAGFGLGALSMLPFVGKFFKPAAKVVGKFKGTPNLVVDITKTPNMPDWYIPAIRKVLNKGEDITDTAATAERQTVHRDILPDGDQVTVTQNMDNQTISVTVENPNSPYLSSTGAGEQPYTIQYSKGKVIEEGKYKGQKEPDTLEVDEPYTAQVGPDTKDVEIEFDLNTYNPKAEVHDTSVLESYATGKKVKSRGTGEVRDPWEGYSPDLKADDYAKGGRVSLSKGGLAKILGF